MVRARRGRTRGRFGVDEMVGVVVATHGGLADELLRTAEGIVGKLERCEAVSVGAGTSMDDARARLADAVNRVDEGEGVLVLTDMFGGTPANLALTFLDEKVEVVTGVNLPMLLKVSGLRGSGKPIAQVAHDLAEAGRGAIGHASELIRQRLEAHH